MTTATSTKSVSSAGSTVTFTPEQSFDSQRMRHYLNGQVSVLHCHHYATLFTQLACDADQFEGTRLLCEASQETFLPVLKDYYGKNNVTDVSDRIAIAEQYFSFIGLGEARFEFSEKRGTVTLVHSHVDEGWVKKWGTNDSRVNFIGEGYIRAAWAAIWDKSDPNAVTVEETQSIVQGSSTSWFKLSW